MPRSNPKARTPAPVAPPFARAAGPNVASKNAEKGSKSDIAALDQLFSDVALSSDAEDVDVLVEFMSERVRNDFALDAEIQGSKS